MKNPNLWAILLELEMKGGRTSRELMEVTNYFTQGSVNSLLETMLSLGMVSKKLELKNRYTNVWRHLMTEEEVCDAILEERERQFQLVGETNKCIIENNARILKNIDRAVMSDLLVSIVVFVKEYAELRKRPPYTSEIASYLDKSTVATLALMSRLKAKGYVDYQNDNEHRHHEWFLDDACIPELPPMIFRPKRAIIGDVLLEAMGDSEMTTAEISEKSQIEIQATRRMLGRLCCRGLVAERTSMRAGRTSLWKRA